MNDETKRPAWPVMPAVPSSIEVGAAYYVAKIAAALHRLREACEYMQHEDGCAKWFGWAEDRFLSDNTPCTCGLAGLLADLLPPGEE